MPKIVRELLLIPQCFSHHLRVIGALRKCADMRELLLPVSDLGSLLKLGALATAFPEAGRFPTAFFRLFFFFFFRQDPKPRNIQGLLLIWQCLHSRDLRALQVPNQIQTAQ